MRLFLPVLEVLLVVFLVLNLCFESNQIFFSANFSSSSFFLANSDLRRLSVAITEFLPFLRRFCNVAIGRACTDDSVMNSLLIEATNGVENAVVTELVPVMSVAEHDRDMSKTFSCVDCVVDKPAITLVKGCGCDGER